MRHQKLGLAAAGLLAIHSGAAVQARAEEAVARPGLVTVQPGETVAQALRRFRFATHLAQMPGAAYVYANRHAALPTSAAPAITSGELVKATVDVRKPLASPTIKFSFAAPGLFNLACFEFTSPHGQVIDPCWYAPFPKQSSGSVKFIDYFQPAGLYAEAGAWTLTSAIIEDATYTATTYTAAQLASLFPNTTLTVVNNGVQDFTPPAVTAGKILTPKVRLSSAFPDFKVQLTVTDDVSGVISPLVFILPPGGFSGSAYTYTAAPVLSGKVLSVNSVAFDQPGIGTIVGYAAVDAAGNTFQDDNPADVQSLFGTTTFKLVK